jgi:hypothetical protein
MMNPAIIEQGSIRIVKSNCLIGPPDLSTFPIGRLLSGDLYEWKTILTLESGDSVCGIGPSEALSVQEALSKFRSHQVPCVVIKEYKRGALACTIRTAASS